VVELEALGLAEQVVRAQESKLWSAERVQVLSF